MSVKVCLDAGHEGKWNQSSVAEAYYESDMNWKLQEYLKKELEARGIEVLTTRREQKEARDLFERGFASKGCDLFISLHSNAVKYGQDEHTDYPIVYVLLDGSSTEIGWGLVKTVEWVMRTRQHGKITTRQGPKGEYYGVLRGAAAAGTPGILLEHSFHTNERAVNWLLKEENLKKLAKKEAECIACYFRVTKRWGDPVRMLFYKFGKVYLRGCKIKAAIAEKRSFS